MAKCKEGPGVRVRIRFPKDADGLMDYLKSLDPETLSGAVYQLAYFGFLFKNALMLKGTIPSVSVTVPLPRRDADSTGSNKSSSAVPAAVDNGTEEEELNSFGKMFGETYKLAAH